MFIINCGIPSVYWLHRQTKPEGFLYQFYSHVMLRDYVAQVSILLLFTSLSLKNIKPFGAMTVVKLGFSQCCITDNSTYFSPS